MTVARKLATYEDLFDLPENVVGEIIHGELVVSPRPASPHAFAASTAGMDLGPFHRRPGGPSGPGGWWILDEAELHLGRHVLVPDLAGWRHERMPIMPSVPWFDLPPDWVCEIISPSSSRRDRIDKSGIYREHDIPWMWLVDPLQRVVEVFQGAGARWILEGVWEGDDAQARMPPFDAVAIELGRWWPENH